MSSGYYLTSSFYYINLGAHMIYVLRNRLQAQSIRRQKIIRILQDISAAVFKQHFISQLLLPQDPLNTNTLKGIFSRLAHCSIMKLDQISMEKMFHLMVLSVKKQIFLTSSPLQMYSLTVSHLHNIVKYMQTQKVSYLEFAIRQFEKIASTYSYIQYLQIKEYMLSELERYQTRIVNFIQSGFQDNNGRLIFKVRNSHNQKSIGSAFNQSDQQCVYTEVKPQQQLVYQQWMSWRTNLVIDFVEDYNSSYAKRNKKENTGSESLNNQKEKSLGDMLNLKFDDLDNFQVKFDMLSSQSDQKYSKLEDIQESENIKKKIIKSTTSKVNNSFKSSIEKEFADLRLQKKEEEQNEPDLLDMMDN